MNQRMVYINKLTFILSELNGALEIANRSGRDTLLLRRAIYQTEQEMIALLTEPQPATETAEAQPD